MTEETQARHDAAEDERARAFQQRRACDRERERVLARVKIIISPFVHPASLIRSPGRNSAEDDRATIEIRAGDYMRLCVLHGHVDGDYYRALPDNARPSIAFLAELDALSRGV